ncbi:MULTISPECIES: methyl-accepting chemotaxis protein [unclassified Vibrio]|uniref:methyl-accepting chemotaxis protein n=1 Tax=unclassified Vibrio TaxID=2614977 RepID=UPI001361C5A6|nr:MULTISPECIES: methyl-accepting chemotaxis protein [unclassified Vibrio]NAW56540.1 methyl-accepting chemotaxis protein [Vibrio sp. V36_P2S2PM302]NAX25754.1 methyl-accepting chemotaxis protein [Vibrio sp. V38_P2S17PM301]NAX30331.1 methyl-accepting chemotaxis protein [Vibrio sp. V37_P2S8PM304]
MNIKQKLYSLGVIAILGIAFLVGATTHFTQTTGELSQATQLVDKLEIRLLNLRRNEKDFLLRHDAKYLDKFEKNLTTFLSLESELSGLLSEHKLPSSQQLRTDILSYQKSFQQLVAGYQTLGLKADQALRNNYYTAFSALESRLGSEDLVKLFEFDEKVEAGELDAQLLTDVPAPQFLKTANALVAQKQVIGLKYDQGLLGEARTRSHSVEKQFSDFSTKLNEQIDANNQQVSTMKTAIVGIIVVLIAGFIYWISRSINLQVAFLLNTIQEIARTNNVGMRANLKGKDELASIGTYFNRLLEKLEGLISGTQTKAGQLSSNTETMHGELQSVIEQFHIQADHTTSMATAVQEMVATISEISESTSVAVEGVQQASVNAQNGRTVVESTVSNIGQLSATLEDSQNSISSLNDHVAQIGGAVNIIQDIAEQTNLLALNAAIEAARAGEQGRGFAVVADEVRALASRTHQSTEEITKVVSAIQHQMSQVVDDINQCNQQGHETLDASQKLDDSLSQIIHDMENIQANSERIASAIEEQGIVMNQVSESITELNTISENNMHSAQQCLVEVDEVSRQARDMDAAVAEFTTSKS